MPISQAQAAKLLGLGQNEASIAVRVLEIPTQPSPHNGAAKLLDEAGFAQLAEAAKRLGRLRPK